MVLAHCRAIRQLSVWEELVDLADLLHADTLHWVSNHTWLHHSLVLLLLLLHHHLLLLLLSHHISRHLLRNATHLLLLLLHHAHLILLEALWVLHSHAWLHLLLVAHKLLVLGSVVTAHYIALRIALWLHFI